MHEWSRARWFWFDLVTDACEVIAASVLLAILGVFVYGAVCLVQDIAGLV